MEQPHLRKVFTAILFGFIFLCSFELTAQEAPIPKEKNHFWSKVQVGGGLAVGFGSGYANVAIAPSAIYNVNEQFALGAGLQYSYLKQRDYYNSHLYGASVIGLFNPIEQIQLSLEVEELRANVTAEPAYFNGVSDNFWNTGLFLGVGYRANNVTVGARYNLLFQEDKGVYGDALMPFIRVYF